MASYKLYHATERGTVSCGSIINPRERSPSPFEVIGRETIGLGRSSIINKTVHTLRPEHSLYEEKATIPR